MAETSLIKTGRETVSGFVVKWLKMLPSQGKDAGSNPAEVISRCSGNYIVWTQIAALYRTPIVRPETHILVELSQKIKMVRFHPDREKVCARGAN